MALQVSSPATNQLLGIGQTNQQLPTYTNLQAADPNNQRAPADIQGSFRPLQTNPVRDIQPQRYFNQQMPQVGVTGWGLPWLSSQAPPSPAPYVPVFHDLSGQQHAYNPINDIVHLNPLTSLKILLQSVTHPNQIL